MTNAEFFSLFSAQKTRRDEPRAAGSSAAAAAPAAHADRGGLMGWGGSGRRYLKAAPGRCPARVRPEVGSFFLLFRSEEK